MWKQHLGPTGAMRAWLESDTRAPIASYVTQEVGNAEV
jgi:soluble epoxide hydrolase/lipid-phosphate phosphatase